MALGAGCSHGSAAVGRDGGAGATGATPDGSSAGGAAPVDGGASSDAVPPGDAGDPGRVLLHRLNRIEYDNTAKDLLGVATTPATRFIDDLSSDTPAGAFDNAAEGLTMSAARYQQYFDAAKSMADAVWADDALKGRIVTCAPDATDACARAIIAAFGLRAWRRPLTDAEVTSLAAFASAAQKDTGDFQAAMKRVVTLMLSSLPFLYKVEIDPAPASLAPHRLSGYELGTRLSYLLWSTMPDDRLLALGDDLQQDAVLAAELDRMLEDPRSDAFVQAFAGQWLGARDLADHAVDPAAYGNWSDDLRAAMTEELYLFFTGLLDRPFDGFLTTDAHYVNDVLGAYYQLADPPADDTFFSVDLPGGQRGFLGLGGFLTATSLATRTSPSKRGDWVMTHLLCAPPGQHAGGNPPLNLGVTPASPRAALAIVLSNPSCSGCHKLFDGVGFGLESYDLVGQFRSSYSPTEPIDATGALDDGTTFDGATELAAALSRDPRLATCAVRSTFSYALGRVLDADDDARVASLRDAWAKGTFRSLLRAIVLGDSFRMRRGEAP
ncbi:MAG TPA: DUF1592 domain-containing protein [Polyangia bacterium]|nr:DUF1592 domain-containing protein [Polyangia bacterium]